MDLPLSGEPLSETVEPYFDTLQPRNVGARSRRPVSPSGPTLVVRCGEWLTQAAEHVVMVIL